MKSFTTKDITKISILAALVFVATYLIKIPSVNGYSHLGDCMILIGVLVLGGRKAAYAGSIGAALADVIGGYMHWVLPTLVIKFLMAAVMGLFIEKILPEKRYNWIAGAVAGGLVQILGYTSVKIVYYGFIQAMVMTPSLIVQTTLGIVLTTVFVGALKKYKVLDRVKGY